MNKFVLTFLLGVISSVSLLAQEQYEIQFSYDAAGNLTLFNRVCINCQNASRGPQLDSVPVVQLELNDDILETALEPEILRADRIVAYPNPVTNLLTGEWVKNQKTVSRVVLFSGIGSQLQSVDISSSEGSLALDFVKYPPGAYILLAQYADGSTKSFHILKK